MSKNSSNLLLKLIIFCVIIVSVVFSFFVEKKPKISEIKPTVQEEKKVIPQRQKVARQDVKQQDSSSIIKKEVPKELLNSELPIFTKYRYTYTYTFNVNGYIQNFNFELPIPNTLEQKQYISDYVINPKPTEIIEKDGSTIAKFKASNLSTGQFKIIVDGIANVRTYNIQTAKKINQNVSANMDLARYLRPEKYIDSNDEYIIRIANGIQGDTQEEILEKTYKYIQNHLQYRIENEVKSAKQALQNGYGKCSEFSSVMTSILRAKNIPARIVTGNIARDNNTPHNWVEVYFKEYGWVTYDPTTMPTQVSVYGADGKLKRIEKRYDVSHDNLQYIQSGLNLFSPYFLTYSTNPQRNGTIQMNQNISIRKF